MIWTSGPLSPPAVCDAAVPAEQKAYCASLTASKARMFCLHHETRVCLMDDLDRCCTGAVQPLFPTAPEGAVEYEVSHPLMLSFSTERSCEQASTYI